MRPSLSTKGASRINPDRGSGSINKAGPTAKINRSTVVGRNSVLSNDNIITSSTSSQLKSSSNKNLLSDSSRKAPVSGGKRRSLASTGDNSPNKDQNTPAISKVHSTSNDVTSSLSSHFPKRTSLATLSSSHSFSKTKVSSGSFESAALRNSPSSLSFSSATASSKIQNDKVGSRSRSSLLLNSTTTAQQEASDRNMLNSRTTEGTELTVNSEFSTQPPVIGVSSKTLVASISDKRNSTSPNIQTKGSRKSFNLIENKNTPNTQQRKVFSSNDFKGHTVHPVGSSTSQVVSSIKSIEKKSIVSSVNSSSFKPPTAPLLASSKRHSIITETKHVQRPPSSISTATVSNKKTFGRTSLPSSSSIVSSKKSTKNRLSENNNASSDISFKSSTNNNSMTTKPLGITTATTVHTLQNSTPAATTDNVNLIPSIKKVATTDNKKETASSELIKGNIKDPSSFLVSKNNSNNNISKLNIMKQHNTLFANKKVVETSQQHNLHINNTDQQTTIEKKKRVSNLTKFSPVVDNLMNKKLSSIGSKVENTGHGITEHNLQEKFNKTNPIEQIEKQNSNGIVTLQDKEMVSFMNKSNFIITEDSSVIVDKDIMNLNNKTSFHEKLIPAAAAAAIKLKDTNFLFSSPFKNKEETFKNNDDVTQMDSNSIVLPTKISNHINEQHEEPNDIITKNTITLDNPSSLIYHTPSSTLHPNNISTITPGHLDLHLTSNVLRKASSPLRLDSSSQHHQDITTIDTITTTTPPVATLNKISTLGEGIFSRPKNALIPGINHDNSIPYIEQPNTTATLLLTNNKNINNTTTSKEKDIEFSTLKLIQPNITLNTSCIKYHGSQDILTALKDGRQDSIISSDDISKLAEESKNTLLAKDVIIKPNAVVCTQAILKGNHKISIGSECIIHPGAYINAEHGPIEIGEGTIIEELVIIINRTPRTLYIGKWNYIQTGAEIIDAMAIGDANIIGSKSHIQSNAEITEACIIQFKATVSHGMIITPASIVLDAYGSVQENLEGEITSLKKKNIASIKKLLSVLGPLFKNMYHIRQGTGLPDIPPNT